MLLVGAVQVVEVAGKGDAAVLELLPAAVQVPTPGAAAGGEPGTYPWIAAGLAGATGALGASGGGALKLAGGVYAGIGAAGGGL